MIVDPAGQLLGEIDVAGEVLSDRTSPVHPQDHPELEGAKAAAELDAETGSEL